MAPASTRLDRDSEGERLRRTVGSIPGPPALEANALQLGPTAVPCELNKCLVIVLEPNMIIMSERKNRPSRF